MKSGLIVYFEALAHLKGLQKEDMFTLFYPAGQDNWFHRRRHDKS